MLAPIRPSRHRPAGRTRRSCIGPNVDLCGRIALLSECTQLVDRLLLVERLFCMEADTGSERIDADKDGGNSEEACVVNRHASPPRSHDADRTIVGKHFTLNVEVPLSYPWSSIGGPTPRLGIGTRVVQFETCA